MAIRYFGPYSWSFHPILKHVKKALPYGKLFNYAGYFHDIEYAKKVEEKSPELRAKADKLLLNGMLDAVNKITWWRFLYKIFGYFFAVFYYILVRIFGVFCYYQNRQLQGNDLKWSIERYIKEIEKSLELTPDQLEEKGRETIQKLMQEGK
jgi:hypothetical protein